MSRPLDAVLEGCRALIGERCSTNASIRDQHAHGEDWQTPARPDAVCFAQTTAEVSAILALCHRHAVPVVPFGAGTSLEGHVTAVRGGISLDLSRMTAILEVNEADLDARVEAGVTRQALNQHLRDRGLFFPVDPGAEATIGGMCATRASGTNAVRYGTIRENVLGLTVVLADGRVLETGTRARKSAAGYDLTRLFVGSEGTLGIITAARLRLYGIPEAISAAVCQFPDLAGAVETVIAVMQSNIPVARIELLDEVQMRACIRYSKLDGYAERPTLFFEFHGSKAGVAEQAQAVEEIAGSFGGSAFAWATSEEERARLWKARHAAYYAGVALRPGCKSITTDVCVPISRLAECMLGAKKDIAASGFTAPIVGHAGDGNFHTMILVDPNDPAEIARGFELDRRIVARALAMGGTCTGEHGVGLGKREFLLREAGADAVEAMRAVKAVFDPRGILNPGKIFMN
ncbi:MAG: FAD-binding protein [Alphaproteobacteria bacterium]|nr:FAD-binding protein [Alphaproteobacteria bacterium]